MPRATTKRTAKAIDAPVAATINKRAKPTPSTFVFTVREVYEQQWSSWNHSGVNTDRQLVGVYSTAVDANKAAVLHLYACMASRDFPDMDNEYENNADVFCQEKGTHGLLHLRVVHGDENTRTLTVSVTEDKSNGEKPSKKPAMTKKQYDHKLDALMWRADGKENVYDDEN